MHRYVERIATDPYEAGVFPQQQHEDQQAPQPSSSSQQAQQSRMVVTRYPSAPVSAIESTRKHVSFDNSTLARSITASSFDEHKMKKAMNIAGGVGGGGRDEVRGRVGLGGNMNISQERLLLDSGRKTPEQICPGVVAGLLMIL